MVINLSELFTARDVAKTLEFVPEFTTVQWQGERIPVVAAEPVRLTLTHLGSRRVRMEGESKMILTIPCDRCLKPVEVKTPLSVRREVDAGADAQERFDDVDEQPFMDGHLLDADELVRIELMMNMPMKVLCSDDCKGVCPKCGKDLNEGTCGCEQGEPDPRMAAILDIFRAGTRKEV